MEKVMRFLPQRSTEELLINLLDRRIVVRFSQRQGAILIIESLGPPGSHVVVHGYRLSSATHTNLRGMP